ncbi:hypothetical protein LWP59_31920 [Amycolatopsis acidiphila]|uniref:hypothetical protein n=1 Tax=Amycolatopsis acidiphila TaxID=715473 RepID=UPI001643A918|nr:hypothetical protein [Amycolatopsis acidiphila]UIJ58666.1 hypothetical protein LWP59_31920 [Amycolatopsis acidiphila]GHG76142.1 hypothetical protein GCM10017788_41420 [Amycolatopsis acidiphila]
MTAAALLALALGCTGCRDHATSSPSAPRPQDELSQIRTTLDAIDSEMAGDGSP